MRIAEICWIAFLCSDGWKLLFFQLLAWQIQNESHAPCDLLHTMVLPSLVWYIRMYWGQNAEFELYLEGFAVFISLNKWCLRTGLTSPTSGSSKRVLNSAPLFWIVWKQLQRVWVWVLFSNKVHPFLPYWWHVCSLRRFSVLCRSEPLLVHNYN